MTKALFGIGIAVFAAWGAQEVSNVPEFEVASVKPAEPPTITGGRMMVRMGCFGGPGSPDPGRFTCNGASLHMLLVQAYDTKMYQVTGPAWMDSERFDITAKVPAGTTKEQFNLMLQKLVKDRFRIVLHHENKELAMYALVVGKNGHKLKEPVEEKDQPFDPALAGDPSKMPPPPPPPPPGPGGPDGAMRGMMVMTGGPGGRGGRGNIMMSMRNGLIEISAKKATIANLVDMLGMQVDRPVVDQTDLKGEFAFALDFAPDDNMRMSGGPMGAAMAVRGPAPAPSGAPGSETAEPSSAPSIFTAVQNQLGLKLEPKKGAVDTIVVDKAEKVPTEN